MDYSVLLHHLETIVRKAGQYILGANGESSEEKSNSKDLVTAADIKAQNIIEKEISHIFPGSILVSEEYPEEDRTKIYNPEFTGFIIDPIDGTFNFKRDMRESGVSIGYINNGEPVVGVLYDPYKDELYSAVKGQGSFRNGKKIKVSPQTELQDASISTSNSYDDIAMARNLRRHLSIYESTGVMPWTSCGGSAVLIMANVACGRVDAYHHNGLKPWDNAAAFLVVSEAGGVVVRLNGEPATFTDSSVIIGTPAIVSKLQSIFSEIDQDLLN